MRVRAKLLRAGAVLATLSMLTTAALLAAQDSSSSQASQAPTQTSRQHGDAASAQSADQSPTLVQPVDQASPDSSVSPVTPGVRPEGTGGGSGGAGAPTDAQSLANGLIGPNYLLGPEDVVEINVFDVPEMSKFDAQVANDGTISVPLLGSVRAAGLTQRQLRDELARDWGAKYLNHPQVSLFIKDFKSRPVSVVGSVAKPGVYYMTGRRSLVEVLAMAGGLASVGAAAGRYVYVEREGGFQDLPQVDGLVQTAPNRVSIELNKLLYSQDTALNIELHPFDVVTVSRAGIVYLVGAFTRPGGYVLDNKDTITALEAIALAQGLGPNARTSQAKIIHRSRTGTVSSETSIDLKKLLRGKAPDVVLADNDILFVPNSNAKAISKGSAQSIIGIITGIAIYRGL